MELSDTDMKEWSAPSSSGSDEDHDTVLEVKPRVHLDWRPKNISPADIGDRFVLKLEDGVKIPILLNLVKTKSGNNDCTVLAELTILEDCPTVEKLRWRCCRKSDQPGDWEEAEGKLGGLMQHQEMRMLNDDLHQVFYVEFDFDLVKESDKPEDDEHKLGEKLLVQTYANRSAIDTVLICEDQKFLCHKAVLFAQCQGLTQKVMRALSNNSTTNGHWILVEIDDMTFEELGIIMRFIYTGKIEEESLQQHAKSLLALSDKYYLKGLHKKCLKMLAKNLNVNNAVDLLEAAHLSENGELKKLIIRFIKENSFFFKTNKGFKNLLMQNASLGSELVMILL